MGLVPHQHRAQLGGQVHTHRIRLVVAVRGALLALQLEADPMIILWVVRHQLTWVI